MFDETSTIHIHTMSDVTSDTSNYLKEALLVACDVSAYSNIAYRSANVSMVKVEAAHLSTLSSRM